MIDGLPISLYFLSIVLVGYLLVSLIFRKQSIGVFETLSLSMLLGSGMVPVIFFYFSLVGYGPSFWLIQTLTLLSFFSLLILGRRGELNPAVKFNAPKGKELVFIMIGIFVFLYFFVIVFVDAVFMPLYSIDSFALWCLKAKALCVEGVHGAFFRQLSLSYSHLNYPLSVPFLISGVYVSLGRFDDSLGKIIFPFFYLAGALFLYSSLRWRLGRLHSFVLMLVFISPPALIRWCSVGIADFPLTVFYAGSIFYLIKFLKEENWRYCLLSFLFSFFCAFTKNEGMAIAAVNVAVLAVFYLVPRFSLSKLMIVLVYAFGLFFFLSPWILWRMGIPATHIEEVSSRFSELWDVKSLARIGEISLIYLKEVVDLRSWGFLWLVLPLAAVFNPRGFKEKCVLAAWVLLAAHIGLYFLAFVISPWSPGFLAGMALERILVHTTPAVIYIIALHLGDLERGAGCVGISDSRS